MTYSDKLNHLQLDFLSSYEKYKDSCLDIVKQMSRNGGPDEGLNKRKSELLQKFQRAFVTHRSLQKYIADQAIDPDSRYQFSVML